MPLLSKYEREEKINYRKALSELLNTIVKNGNSKSFDETAVDWDKLSFAGSMISIRSKFNQSNGDNKSQMTGHSVFAKSQRSTTNILKNG